MLYMYICYYSFFSCFFSGFKCLRFLRLILICLYNVLCYQGSLLTFLDPWCYTKLRISNFVVYIWNNSNSAIHAALVFRFRQVHSWNTSGNKELHFRSLVVQDGILLTMFYYDILWQFFVRVDLYNFCD